MASNKKTDDRVGQTMDYVSGHDLLTENKYLKDALLGAIKYIYRYANNIRGISGKLDDINDAKNNWQRGQLVQEAYKQVHKANLDVHVFRKVLTSIRNGCDLYDPHIKKDTLELGALADAENFGMYATNENELREHIRKFDDELMAEEVTDE